MMNPFDAVRFQPRPALTPSEVRAVVFTTTRMRLGYDVEEVDAFLDHVEWSMEQMLHEIALLRQQLLVADRNNEARIAEVRQALEQLLGRLGGMPLVSAAAARDVAGYAMAAGAVPTHQRPLEGPGRRAAADWAAGAPVTGHHWADQSGFAAAPQAAPSFGVPQAASSFGGPQVASSFGGPQAAAPQRPHTPTYTVTDAAAPPQRPPSGKPAGGPPPQQQPAPYSPPAGGPIDASPSGAPFQTSPSSAPFQSAPSGAPFQAAPSTPPFQVPDPLSAPPTGAPVRGAQYPQPTGGATDGRVPPVGPVVDLPPPSAA